ncbi:GTPase Era [Comamonas thiooxydans]|uniref:GTPase Era n=1 Tax=Comamonas thiooxydans TaxID=363952 RepID=UPI000A6C6D50|nr:GTPase Era [Comamonas thiooxydans]
MTDAAKKKIAGTAGAEKAKGQKGPKSVTTDISDPSLDYISAMLAAAKPGSTPTAIRDQEEEAPARVYAPEEQRCGLIAIVGKPNVGKSTLMNALVGQKISITSRKAQTTRHRITGIRTKDETQFVFVDTPGFQTKHSTALNKSLNKTVMGAIGDVDLILFVVEAGSFTLADAKVLSLFKPGIPTLLIANKLDTVGRRAEIAPWLRDMQERHPFAEFVPMSAKNKKDIERMYGICAKYLPQQPWFYGEDELTDRSEKFLASETLREKLFRFTGDELPYTSTVVIDKFEEEPSPKFGRFMRIAATIVVERDGHKAMVIGQGGERLKRISTETRQELEKLFNAKVFLEVWVKVKSGWADDEARVKSFGYE